MFNKVFKIYVCVFCLLSTGHVAHAQEATTDSGYAVLDRFFNGLQTLQAEFSQSVQDSRGQVTDKSGGKLIIKKPGKFRWDYLKPSAQTIVSDGARIWLYDPELEQVTIRRAEQSLNGTPASLLSGEGNLRDSFEVEHVEQRDGMLVINLAPKRADTDFKLLQMALRNEQLVAMSLTDKLGQTTLLQFAQLKRNAAVAESSFKFTVPKGVDVVDNTSTARPNAK